MSDPQTSGGPDRADAPARTSGAARVGADLWPRVVSGLVLAGIALAATLYGSYVFAALVALVCAVVSWEWGRIVRGADADAVMVVHVVAVLSGIGLAGAGLPALGAMAVVVGTILAALLSFGRQAVLSGLGVLFAGLPGVALVWLRGDEPYGLWVVLFLLIVAAVTDTAAYFSGRLIGGAKLWPAVSPNKTWAGLGGAVIGAAVAGGVFANLVTDASPVWLAVAGAAVAVIAQVGDLGESALKRRFAAKDASNLIPGHGGFMDRVDGLVLVVMVAALLAVWLDAMAPARALLFG